MEWYINSNNFYPDLEPIITEFQYTDNQGFEPLPDVESDG